jgi:hypothetical protein
MKSERGFIVKSSIEIIIAKTNIHYMHNNLCFTCIYCTKNILFFHNTETNTLIKWFRIAMNEKPKNEPSQQFKTSLNDAHLNLHNVVIKSYIKTKMKLLSKKK